MRTKRSIYNTLAAAFLQLVNMVVSFILPRLITQQYGSAMSGLVNSTRTTISYFTIVEAGLMGAAIFALYKPLADKDDRETSAIVSAANRYYNISGFFFSSLVLVTTFLYPLLVTDKAISPVAVGALVAIIGASGAMEFFLVGKYKVLFTADQKSYVISLINAVGVVVNAAILVGMMHFGFDMVVVQLAALAGFLLRSGLYAAFGRRAYRRLDFRAEPNNRALDKRWDSFFLQILGLVTSATPLVVVTLANGLVEANVYAYYNMVFLAVSALLSTFNNGLSAMFGDMLAKNELPALQRAYGQYEYLYYALLGWGYACAAILVMPFMGIYTRGITDAVYMRPLLAVLFVLAGLTTNIKTPQGMLLLSAGLFRETRVQSMIQAGINLTVSIALAPSLGIAGVLIGTIAANVYRCIDQIFFIPKMVTKLSPVATLRRVGRMTALSCVAVLPALLLDIRPASWGGWILWAVPTAMWSLLVFAGGNLLMEHGNARDIAMRFRTAFARSGNSGGKGVSR